MESVPGWTNRQGLKGKADRTGDQWAKTNGLESGLKDGDERENAGGQSK